MKRTKAKAGAGPIAQAIIKWPLGFAFPAVIYPIGSSESENEAILRVVRKALGKKPSNGASRRAKNIS